MITVGQLPELHGQHLPAGGVTQLLNFVGGDVRHYAIERLAVQVDDPHDLAESLHRGVEDGLPDRALVELCVAEQ